MIIFKILNFLINILYFLIFREYITIFFLWGGGKTIKIAFT